MPPKMGGGLLGWPEVAKGRATSEEINPCDRFSRQEFILRDELAIDRTILPIFGIGRAVVIQRRIRGCKAHG